MNVPNVHTHTHSVVAGGLDTSVLWVLTVCVSQGPQEKGLRPDPLAATLGRFEGGASTLWCRGMGGW